jgi:hypothetical protein
MLVTCPGALLRRPFKPLREFMRCGAGGSTMPNPLAMQRSGPAEPSRESAGLALDFDERRQLRALAPFSQRVYRKSRIAQLPQTQPSRTKVVSVQPSHLEMR